ncbi:hypothetical protein ACFV4N_32155 [Actinosynnema sp. NPDC059797]
MDTRDHVSTEEPFATALRAAIAARGLGLDRIRQRLLDRGTEISVAALSYWQSGRSKPERRGSIQAVRHLEEVLGLGPGALTDLLGEPRQRGRTRRTADAPALEEMWPDRERIEPVLSLVDRDEALTRLTLHIAVEVAADRGVRTVRTRQVLRAERDGADRWVTVHDLTQPGPAPRIVPIRSCALGRVVRREEDGVVAAELLFDRVLARGETIVVEYASVVDGPPYPRGDDTYCSQFRTPVRDYAVEVQFDPAALPTSVRRHVVRPDVPHPVEHQRMAVSPEGYTHAVALGFGPGMFCVAWEWPD